MSSELKKLIGARILSEANDLKRTIPALAQEINYDEEKLNEIVKGNCEIEDTYEVIEKMGKSYPIDHSELYFAEDDCVEGAKIMTAEESEKSSRIFNRKDKDGNRTEYYEYRDTAMSKAGPFKPEWIKELRVVDDDDPHNPDVAYNNGHFLHQVTFFIGPVNFYWEVNGKKYCQEMNTGDSNYITPFWPHSFTSRNKDELALILAVTYGGDVRRALKEVYMLGFPNITNYKLDADQYNRATIQLILQHMANENMTKENLNDLVKERGVDLNLDKVFSEQEETTIEELEKLAECLNIEINDLLVSKNAAGNEVVVKTRGEDDSYFFPNNDQKRYKIYPMARCTKMPLMKGFDIEVLTEEVDIEKPLFTSLHSYVYHYGDAPITFKWAFNGQEYEKTLNPGDSTYLKPFVRHAYAKAGEGDARLLVVRVSGAVNITTQKELSYFADIDRVIESKCWFD